MIGIVTALEKEYAAMSVMLDAAQEYFAPGSGAGRRYLRGTVPATSGGQHTVVVALSLDMGNNASAIRTSRMLDHFPAMRHVLLVGMAGGVPNPKKAEDHVRLGDVVVSDRNGVVQYDLGKEQLDAATGEINFIIRTPPRPPGAELLEAARLMRAGELRGERPWLKGLERAKDLPNSARPGAETDVLYDTLDQTKCFDHPLDPQRVLNQPRVFLGAIGSADRVLKNPILRDALRDQYGVKAIEMEGSGVADATWQLERSYLVVRGICDYCDTKKNDVWQEYAAGVAAAYTRGLLASMPAKGDEELPAPTAKSPAKIVYAEHVEKQQIIQGNYYEIHGDGNVLGDNFGSVTVTKTTAAPLDPEVKRALAEIHRHLSQPEQRQTQELLDAVRGWREGDVAAQRELREMLDGLRRGFNHLQTRELPAMDQRLRDAIAEVTEIVKADADLNTGLELTIPLIPLLLDYKVNLDLGGGLDLRQWWESVREKLLRG